MGLTVGAPFPLPFPFPWGWKKGGNLFGKEFCSYISSFHSSPLSGQLSGSSWNASTFRWSEILFLPRSSFLLSFPLPFFAEADSKTRNKKANVFSFLILAFIFKS